MNQIQPNRIEPYECVIKCIFSHFVTWIWFNLDWDRQPANIKWNERGVKGNATYEWNEMEFCVAQILWSNVRQLNWASKAASIFMEIWKSFSLLGLTAPIAPPHFLAGVWQSFLRLALVIFHVHRSISNKTTGKISSSGFPSSSFPFFRPPSLLQLSGGGCF